MMIGDIHTGNRRRSGQAKQDNNTSQHLNVRLKRTIIHCNTWYTLGWSVHIILLSTHFLSSDFPYSTWMLMWSCLLSAEHDFDVDASSGASTSFDDDTIMTQFRCKHQLRWWQNHDTGPVQAPALMMTVVAMMMMGVDIDDRYLQARHYCNTWLGKWTSY